MPHAGAGPAQAEPGCSSASNFDSLFDDSNLAEAFDMPDFDPLLPFVANMAGPAYRPQDFNFGAVPTPSVNQGFNTSIPSHLAAHQHQWDADVYVPTSNPSLHSFGAPATLLFNPAEYTDAARLTGSVHQKLFLNIVANSQSTDAPFGTEVEGGRYVSGKVSGPVAHSTGVLGPVLLFSCLPPMEHQSAPNLFKLTNKHFLPQECLAKNQCLPRLDPRQIRILRWSPFRRGVNPLSTAPGLRSQTVKIFKCKIMLWWILPLCIHNRIFLCPLQMGTSRSTWVRMMGMWGAFHALLLYNPYLNEVTGCPTGLPS